MKKENVEMTQKDYIKKYDRKSLIWLFWVWIIRLLLGNVVFWDMFFIPSYVVYIWRIVLLLPILLICIAICFSLIQVVLHVVCLLIGRKYENTRIAKLIEKTFSRVFPKKLFSWNNDLPKRSHKFRTIYYGVIVWVILLAIVFCFVILKYAPGLVNWINEWNQAPTF